MYFFKDFYLLSPSEKSFIFLKGSMLVEDGKIKKILADDARTVEQPPENAEIIEGKFKKMIMPGLIQTHIHLCQTLYRNLSEEVSLLDWLKNGIWPYEAALNRCSMGNSVVYGLKEIIKSGTTAVLDMGTVHHQDIIFQIMEMIDFRYTGGKAMMDDASDAPQSLRESTSESIQTSFDLMSKYHGKSDGLINYAFTPRFLLSCSEGLLREVKNLSDKYNILIHTHGSEHPLEVAQIKEKTGCSNIVYLEKIDALNRSTVIAHMVHPDENEKRILEDISIPVVHCPSANLKLGSGIAPIAEYISRGITVGIGCDGAPCNNSLNIIREMKTASLIQKGVNNNPALMSAEDTIRLATINGAKILRKQGIIGELKEGFDADIIVLDMDTPQTLNFEKAPAAAVVYGAESSNVESTMVRGKFLYRDGIFSKEIDDLDKFTKCGNEF